MQEWDIVTVIVVLVGLFISVGNPIIKLNTSLTKLNDAIRTLQREHEELDHNNTDAHRRIWQHNEQQDRILEDHKIRLHDLDGK